MLTNITLNKKIYDYNPGLYKIQSQIMDLFNVDDLQEIHNLRPDLMPGGDL